MGLYVDIKKTFPGFSLNIKFQCSNERIGLLGSSGSGKSMTLRCIAGLVTPDEGKIILNGKIFFDSKKGINIKPQKRKIGFLFQNYALFPHLTVKENIAFGIAQMSITDRNLKIYQLLEKFHLTELENRYPHQISGGQQQRTSLARTIASEPDILLLDEPFSALDEYLRSHMIKEMIEYLKELNILTLFVTHNMEEAYQICRKLAIITNGQIQTFSEKTDVFQNPQSSQICKITGCKNIIPAVRINDEYIEVPLWNVKINTSSKIKSKIGYCAIRSHYITLSSEEHSYNIFKTKIVGNTESPFSQTVYLKFEHMINDTENYHIQWDINNDIWDKIRKSSGFVTIHLPKEKIMYFEK